MALAEEIQDDQIYLWDLQNELREIDARREEILHQINCVKLNKTQNLPDTTKMTPEEKPTQYSAEEEWNNYTEEEREFHLSY